MGILYRPEESVAADFIPFYWQGRYHLFYLRDWRNAAEHGEGTPWWQLVTDDMVNFQDWGEALARGVPESQDLWVFTGSVIERQGVFSIYYTGHNGHFAGTGKPVQAVLRATSSDLRTWTKDESFAFFAPTNAGYEADDWRDPFVFWNQEAGEYWMLLAARFSSGPDRHRGCVALAASPDLETWEVRDPFWAPDQYYTHECPDLFRMGDWWYLVYSTFSERTVTHYRMSRSLEGPWLAPENDTFDTRAYYAAKTASDGDKQRYSFGWLATREGETDSGGWQWGGNLVVHEVVQRPDGTLAVRIPESVAAEFCTRRPLQPCDLLGEWRVEDERFAADATGRFSALDLGDMPQTCLIEAEVEMGAGASSAGMLLRCQDEMAGYYQLRLEPAGSRIVFDRWPRPGDAPFIMERPLSPVAGRSVHLRVLVDGTCIVAYVDNEVALSCRMYDHPGGHVGLFAADGPVSFHNVRLWTLA